jgi:hypothetical protein
MVLHSDRLSKIGPSQNLIRSGSVIEHRQDLITKSAYHSLKEGSASGDGKVFDTTRGGIRYWSDFSHVSYVPRTIQAIPDTSGREIFDGNWNIGRELFTRYNEVRQFITLSFALASNLGHEGYCLNG